MHRHLRRPVLGSPLNFAGELRIRTRNCPVLLPERSSVPQVPPLRCLLAGRLVLLERCGGLPLFVRRVFRPRRLTTRSSGPSPRADAGPCGLRDGAATSARWRGLVR